jgi:co-chaperonin GroES (HSP10)
MAVNILARALPLADRVVIKMTPRTETVGNIAIPQSSQERKPTGTIVRLGPDVKNKNLKVGDTVVTSSYAGLELRDPLVTEDDEYLLLREEDLLAIIPPA